MGSSISEIHSIIPRLSTWLQKVFWVMGGYILTTGFLTTYIAKNLSIQEHRASLALS